MARRCKIGDGEIYSRRFSVVPSSIASHMRGAPGESALAQARRAKPSRCRDAADDGDV